MNDDLTTRIAEFRFQSKVRRHRLAMVYFLLGSVVLLYGLWIRADITSSPFSPEQIPMSSSDVHILIAVTTRITLAYVITTAGVGLLLAALFSLIGSDNRTERVLRLLESAFGLVEQKPQQRDSIAGTTTNVVLYSIVAGVVLTAATAALASIGGVGGEYLAKVIGYPAVLWSNLAYGLHIFGQVNGLLADPGGMFCFADAKLLLRSHLWSALPAFTLFAAAIQCLLLVGARYSRNRGL